MTGPAVDIDHGTYTVLSTWNAGRTPKTGYLARCACGWESDTFPTAGLAGGAWDRHRGQSR